MEETKIPKLIHYCWFGGNPIPDELQDCIASWSRIMPEYKIQRWDESNFDINICDYTQEAYAAKKYAYVADFVRVYSCYQYGGICFDVDVEVIKPFDDLLDLEGFCGFESYKPDLNKGLNFGLAFGLAFGLTKGNPVGKLVIDDYYSRHFVNNNGMIDMTTCTTIQTYLFQKLGMRFINEVQVVNGITVFPPEYFAPICSSTDKITITENTYSIHHYASSWREPADILRRKLRLIYGRKYGFILGSIVGTYISYSKFYGIIGMWKYIFQKIFRNNFPQNIGVL